MLIQKLRSAFFKDWKCYLVVTFKRPFHEILFIFSKCKKKTIEAKLVDNKIINCASFKNVFRKKLFVMVLWIPNLK